MHQTWDRRAEAYSRGRQVKQWLRFAFAIDRLNEWVGKAAVWLVLVMTVISAGNAVVRKAFDISSNSLLEIQWYLFSGVFLLCAGYALQKNAHVRIDIISNRFGPRVNAWIDILGTLFFLLPIVVLVGWLSWWVFLESWHSGEMSNSAGGLIIWPARLLVPVGFGLLLLQGLSELVKRIAFLAGHYQPPGGAPEKSDEEKLAEEIRRSRAAQEGQS